MLKIFKLFGVKIFEIEELTPKEAEQKAILSQHNPKGEVLEYETDIDNSTVEGTVGDIRHNSTYSDFK